MRATVPDWPSRSVGPPTVRALCRAAADGSRDAVEALRGAAAEGALPATEALGVLGDPESLDVLVKLLNYPTRLLPRPHTRAVAARALGRLGDNRAVPALADALSDGNFDYWVRRDVREALIALATPEAIAALHGIGTASEPRAGQT